jgi:serine/threonine protein kinase/Leucine-rich repeat (LRR) protein
MSQAAVCPDWTEYLLLAAGKLADADEEELLLHLERCDLCAQRLSTLAEKETLAELVQQNQAKGIGAADAVVVRLIERLSKLRPDDASGGAGRTKSTASEPRLVFACPNCSKSLKVKTELAGRKVKCPGCQQPFRVPSAPEDIKQRSEPVAQPGSMETVSLEAKNLPATSTVDGGNLPSRAAEQRKEQPRLAQDENKELYDFLAPPQAPDELGRLGPYRVLQVLGAGGMGVVFRAEDPHLSRLVALKAMLPGMASSASARQRFLREARAAAAIKHDHIVTIYQVGEDRGVPFLAMDFLEGEPLDARLKRDDKLPVTEVLRIGQEMALGLAAAHERGLIHRDIKPANVWLEGKKGRVKILDFGLARAVGEEGQITQQGAIVGTPAYMAPEQAQGKSLDGRCDLFSLGCVLYRLATGEQPFRGSDMVSTLMAVATVNPAPPVSLNFELPTELSDFIMQLLAKNPEERPASAQDAAERLAEIAREPALSPVRENTTVSSRQAPGTNSPVPGRRYRRSLFLAVALAVLIPVSYWLASIILRVETPNGTLIVEMDDDVEALIKNGKVILSGPDGNVRYTLSANERQNTIEAGVYTVRVDGADGLVLNTKEFTLKKDGQVKVRVTVAPKAVAKVESKKEPLKPDPDRQAAEYVLSVGGTIRINNYESEIKQVAILPREPFRLTWVELGDCKKVGDEGLSCFKDCKNLTHLGLRGTPVTDAGVFHFQGCKGLKDLDLSLTAATDASLAYFKDLRTLKVRSTQIGNPGLAHLKGCTTLEQIDLALSRTTDDGLANFKDCKDLTYLSLQSIPHIGDVGLAHFKNCKKLKNLILDQTRVTDAGLDNLKDCKDLTWVTLCETKAGDKTMAQFKSCKNLIVLKLTRTPVTDAGLRHLKDCERLETIELIGTNVTDAGLDYLKDSKSVRFLWLDGSKVTAAGIEKFKKASPMCFVLCEKPLAAAPAVAKKELLEPDPDRRAAEYVVSVGGTVCINGQDQGITVVAGLPKEPFRLTWVKIVASKQVGDVGLSHFKDCRNLKYLCLADLPAVTDAGLGHFKECKNLTYLCLAELSAVTDAGMAYFKDCKNLTSIDLNVMQLGAPGLAHFKNCKDLTYLGLAGPQISDEGLASFKDCKNLAILHMPGVTKVSDAGLIHFKDCKSLDGLNVTNSQVGDSGLAYLKKYKNLARLALGATKVSDSGLAHLKDYESLTELYLPGTEITDAGVTHLKDCKKLTALGLGYTKVSHVGLAHLKDYKNLTALFLDGTMVSDACLTYFKDCKNLANLSLSNTQISDAGLEHLRNFKNLTSLNLQNTKVTAVKLKEFKKALPNCKVEWD